MSSALNYKGKLLMPQATAVWLIENTALTFEQIADFTGMPVFDVHGIADEEIGLGIVGRDPIENGELTQDELDRAQADPNHKLKLSKRDLPPVKARAKGPRYTPVSKRGDKPDAIAYIIKHNPEISDAQICKLIGTTKPTIKSVRERTHANMSTIRPRHPAELGLCTFQEYEKALDKGLKAAGKDPEVERAKRKAEEEAQRKAESQGHQGGGDDIMSGFDFSNFLPNKPPAEDQQEQND